MLNSPDFYEDRRAASKRPGSGLPMTEKEALTPSGGGVGDRSAIDRRPRESAKRALWRPGTRAVLVSRRASPDGSSARRPKGFIEKRGIKPQSAGGAH